MIVFKTPTDFRKSLEARLKVLASKNNQDLQRIRRKIAFERFLARIFQREDGFFALKGGYAMELRFANARATKDIDLTCLHRAELANLSIGNVMIRELRKLVKTELNDYFSFVIT